MLNKTMRISALTLSTSLLFTIPTYAKPLYAEQSIESKIDDEMVHNLKMDLINCTSPFQRQYLKDKAESDRIKAEKLKKEEEERLRKEKELEKQNDFKNNSKRTFLVSYYGATYSECSNNKFITASGIPVKDGHIAVPRSIPFGSKIIIDGREYIATDTGNPKYICILRDGTIRVDVFVPRLHSESTSNYEKRISNMGIKKVVGELYIK